MSVNYSPALCPMPGCTSPLHVAWMETRPVYLADLNGGELPAPSDAYTSAWDVRCEDGHVVLLPGDPTCPCGKAECNGCGGYDFDGSEEARTFRRQDVERLRDLLERLGERVA